VKLDYSLLLHFLSGLILAWIDNATARTSVKRSAWLLRQPLFVQYLLALIFELLKEAVVYEPDRLSAHRVALTPVKAVAMWCGFLVVGSAAALVAKLRAPTQETQAQELAPTDASAAAQPTTAPQPSQTPPTGEPIAVSEDSEPKALPNSDSDQRRERLDSKLGRY
jgi:hypothetical protein